jgi:hypothetical protein
MIAGDSGVQDLTTLIVLRRDIDRAAAPAVCA